MFFVTTPTSKSSFSVSFNGDNIMSDGVCKRPWNLPQESASYTPSPSTTLETSISPFRLPMYPYRDKPNQSQSKQTLQLKHKVQREPYFEPNCTDYESIFQEGFTNNSCKPITPTKCDSLQIEPDLELTSEYEQIIGQDVYLLD